MFCNQCGTFLPDNSQFCIKCGAKMPTQTAYEYSAPAPAPVPAPNPIFTPIPTPIAAPRQRTSLPPLTLITLILVGACLFFVLIFPFFEADGESTHLFWMSEEFSEEIYSSSTREALSTAMPLFGLGYLSMLAGTVLFTIFRRHGWTFTFAFLTPYLLGIMAAYCGDGVSDFSVAPAFWLCLLHGLALIVVAVIGYSKKELAAAQKTK